MQRAPPAAQFVPIDPPPEHVIKGRAHYLIVALDPVATSAVPVSPTRRRSAVRFATFNIASGRSPVDGRIELARLADAIATLDADVLSLQEVDRDQPRSGGADLTAVAAAAMGARHQVFAPTLYGTPGRRWTSATDRPRDGAAYGCALISRFPLRNVALVRIPAPPVVLPLWVPGAGLVIVREEPRVAIIADVELDAAGPVVVVATHLPFVPAWKGWALRRLVREVATRANPLLLLGDLNLRGDSARRLSGYTALASAPTFPSDRPRLQLDHVLLRDPLRQFGSVVATSTPVLPVSDHRPLVVDVELSERGSGSPQP